MPALREHKPGTLLQSPSGYPIQVLKPYEDDPDMIQVKILSGLNAGRLQGVPATEESMEPLTSLAASRVAEQYKSLLPPEVELERSADEPAKPKKRKRKSARKKPEAPPVEAKVAADAPVIDGDADPTAAALEVAASSPPSAAVASRGSKRSRKRKPATGTELTGAAPAPRTRAATVDWLDEVTLNGKGINGTIKLGQRTLIHGPNASNKTTILNAVTLLAVGYANDLGGRDGVKAADRIFTLTGPGEDSLVITGHTDGGQKGYYKLTVKDDGGLKKSRRSPVANARLLYDEIQAILRGEEAKIRTFLVRAIYPQLRAKHLFERLGRFGNESTPDLSEARRTVLGNMLTTLVAKVDAKTPTELLNLDKAAKKEATLARVRGGALKELADDQRGRANVEAVPIPEGAVENLEGELVQWRQHRDKIMRDLSTLRATLVTVNAHKQHQTRLDGVNVQLAELTVELDAARAAQAVIDKKLSEGSSGLVEAANVIHHHLRTSPAGSPCFACGVPTELDRIVVWSQTWQPYYNQHTAATAATTQALLAARTQVAELERRHSVLRGEVATLDRIVSTTPTAPTATIESYEAALEQTKAGITLRENQHAEFTAGQLNADAVAGTADDAHDRSKAEESTAVQYDQLAVEIARIRGALAAEAVEGFAAKVQEWLPKGDRFGVDLEVGAVGFIRPNHVPGDPDGGPPMLQTAWSGGETIRLLGALAAASIPVDCEWPLLVLPDKAQDAKYLRATMVALAKWPGQVLMTSTCAPHRGKVQGWTLIDSTKIGETAE
jgi:energy-coupling factor transporter ATP-binding protein EcfA2